MTTLDTQRAQARAARIAGATYLLVMAGGIFAESFVRGSLIVWGDAAQTAQNIIGSKRLFRIGIATDLVTYSADVVLAWALFVLLRPVERNLASLAVLFRLAQVAIAYVATLLSLVALVLLSGADYLRTLDSSHLHSLGMVALGAQGQGLGLSFVPLGLGSAIFAYLFARSGYVPRVLAVWGIFSSVLLATYYLVVNAFPAVWRFEIAIMIPMGIYEITLGFWLLLKGVKLESSSCTS